MNAPPVDRDTERAVLASVMLVPARLKRLIGDLGLRPEHFGEPRNGKAFEAMVTVTDRGARLDHLTFVAELEQHRALFGEPATFANDLYDQGEPIAYGHSEEHVQRLRDLHRRRQLRHAGLLLVDASQSGDEDQVAEAESLLTTPDEAEPTTWSGLQLAERYADRLDAPAAQAFRWPFSKLNHWTGGGLRRKQIVLIGGWTSNGKSVLYDQILEKLAEQNLRVHSYINEMSEAERMDRTVARLSGVPFQRVYSKDLDPEQDVAIRRCLTRIKVGITECAGWTAPEIARHIRWNRWDVAGVDILHEIAHREERDLAEIAQTLRAAAKQADCVLVACVHLNDNRITSPQRPRPVMRDVRGTGMLVRGADVVLLVHRDDDEDGIPTNDGILFAAKIRNGQPNAMGLTFRPESMEFVSAAGTEGDW